MDEIVTGISAFNYYRTPPQVLFCLPPIVYLPNKSQRRYITEQPAIQYALGSPLHLLVFDRNAHTGAASVKHHVWTSRLPKEAICDSEVCGQVSSPLFTLLTMASAVSETQLILAMYEMCGSFAVYKPTPQMAALLAGNSGTHLDSKFGWRCVADAAGRPTNLWQRAPLIELDELHAFSQEVKGLRGSAAFERAARAVTGMCASPFEVQASLLFGLPRARGGWGMTFENNKVLRLSGQAKSIALKDYCVADLYFESPDGHRVLDVECQGNVVHGAPQANVLDAERTTALRASGVDVVEITHAQLRSQSRTLALMEHIHDSLGITLRPKTPRHMRAEQLLRSNIFIDWASLV